MFYPAAKIRMSLALRVACLSNPCLSVTMFTHLLCCSVTFIAHSSCVRVCVINLLNPAVSVH